VFVGRNFGYYRYSATRLLDDAKPDRYRLGYSFLVVQEMTLKELQNLMLANLVFIFKIILKLLITLNFLRFKS
jgi:hypothetical protein